MTNLSSDTPERTSSREAKLSSISFVDQSSDLYPFIGLVTGGGLRDRKEEERDGQLREAGKKMAKLFGLGRRGPLLEIGWGGNRLFAEGVYEVAKIPLIMFGPDSFEGRPDRQLLPQNAERDGKTVAIIGRAEDLAITKGISNRKFGSIVFNGSLFGGGSNMTIEQQLERSFSSLKINPPKKIGSFVNDQLFQILKNAKNLLSPKGVIIITSDRFSQYAPERSGAELSLEKLEFLNIIAEAINLGARNITLIGLNTYGAKIRLGQLNIPSLLPELNGGIDMLPNVVKSDYIRPERISQIKRIVQGKVPNNVSLIDSIGIEF